MCKEYNDDEKTKTITLYQAIKNLYKKLKINCEKYEQFAKIYQCDYMYFNDKSPFNIYLMNREIQESFYEFVNNICLYFYENLSIKSSADESKNNKDLEMNVIFDDDRIKNLNKYNEEETIFLEELKTTMKYQSFVYIFLQSYNPIDLYKIPLMFTEEFLSIISQKKEEIRNNTSRVKFFKLIDDLYLPRKSLDKKELNFLIINFSYFRNYKNRIDREIYDRDKKRFNYDKTKMIKFISNEKRMLIYQTYELDDTILLNYLHIIKNLKLNEYIQIFSSKFLIEENTLNKIEVTDIESLIENNCIKENILTKGEICCANILLLFTISLKSLRDTMDGFLGVLFQNFTVFRKYYSLLLRMIIKLSQVAPKDKKISNNISNIIMCYYPCINKMRNKHLVPNEDLMKMITQFNKIDTKEFNLNENGKKEEIEEKKENEENIEKIELYGKELEEKDITKENLYVFSNFSSRQFFSEETIVEYINNTDKEEFVTKTGETLYPRIRFNNGKHKIECFFISQKTMLGGLIKEYKKYIENLDDSKITLKIILDSILNIFIYMRNNDEFDGMDDIFDTLKFIFYNFLNQLVVLKVKKENSIRQKYNNNK